MKRVSVAGSLMSTSPQSSSISEARAGGMALEIPLAVSLIPSKGGARRTRYNLVPVQFP